MKGATIAQPLSWATSINFNPRSREGSDEKLNQTTTGLLISIHAPVKGATSILENIIIIFPISIHAPVKGATLADIVESWAREISIHAPVKGATIHVKQNTLYLHISIHAPVKGATSTGTATLGSL